jgi:diguanylate cyclase (GGDEF)-like protein/PAS domain S-box-containing protein
MVPRKHLRPLLILALVVANLLVILLATYSLDQSRKQHEQRAEVLTQNIASAVDQNISGSVARIDLGLQVFASELERQLAGKGLDEKAINDFLSLHERRLPEVEGFRASNSEGMVAIGKGVSKANPVDASDRDYFTYHRDHVDGSLQITRPVFGRIVNHYIVIFARRYNFPNGRFAGVVFATINVDHFTTLLSRFDLGPRGTIILRDLDLGLVARHPPLPNQPAGQIGNSVVSSEGRQLVESGVQFVTYHTPAGSDGLERIYSFRRLNNAPMIVNAGMASEDYLADWYVEAYKTYSFAFCFFLMSVISGVFLIRLLNQTVREGQRNNIYLQHASDGIQIADSRGKLVEVNDRFCSMLGYERAEMLAMNVTTWLIGWDRKALLDEFIPMWLASPEPQTVEAKLRRKNGSILNAVVNISAFNIDGKKYLYASFRDIRERMEAVEQIRHLAYFDSLTELPNRRLLMDRIGQALITGERSKQLGVLMILDLDNFKILNDTKGHDVGDRLLIEVAVRLRATIRQEDTIARLGGDEFVVLAENLGTDESSAARLAEGIAEKIRRTLELPYAIARHEPAYHSTSSIGLTVFCGLKLSIDDLLKQADVALYQAKGAGRNKIRFFNPAMQQAIESRSIMEAALRNGLKVNEFQLFYQPQVNQNGEIIGAEALLRWFPMNLDEISPAQFIPLAEDTGLIVPLGQWVLETACAQIRAWDRHPNTRDLSIAINVSARQFRQEDFVQQVRDALQRSGANPALLKLELTESVVLESVKDVIVRMDQIRALGVTFSLDDFGIGFSSLSYLKLLPIDEIKIDLSFVRDITTDADDAAIVRAIIAMGQSLEIDVIAEGVEEGAQLKILKESGCTKYQGFMFGKPSPIDDWGRLFLSEESQLQRVARSQSN